MIKDRFLNEANRIRETYIRTLDLIKNEEYIINQYKDEITSLMENNDEYIQKNSRKDVSEIKENLKEELMEIETKITKIVEKLNPHFKKIEDLKEDSKTLFNLIRVEYPKMSDLEIQKEILYFIKI